MPAQQAPPPTEREWHRRQCTIHAEEFHVSASSACNKDENMVSVTGHWKVRCWHTTVTRMPPSLVLSYMGAIQRRTILRKRIGHSLKRFKERHALYLDEYELMSMANQIVEGNSKFVLRLSKRRTVHKILHNGQWLPVVYSAKDKLILTVFHNKWIRRVDGVLKIVANYHLRKENPKQKKRRVPYQVRNKYSKQRLNEWV